MSTLKLQFKHQPYQQEAVDAVVNVFEGQPYQDGISYIIDSGAAPEQPIIGEAAGMLNFALEGERDDSFNDAGLKNNDIQLSQEELLTNLRAVTSPKRLPAPERLVHSTAGPNVPNIDIEMETGTGKTYVYIKTIMELNKKYGWGKFIIVVPSVAIREGVLKTFESTAEHFRADYGTAPKVFIYNSADLDQIDEFSSNRGVQVMIINIQAFNSKGKDQRRIFMELEEFRSRRPIDVIQANRPIIIIDEPQKISAPQSQKSILELNPLMILRYSATHKDQHNLVHRLDALDAYNQKLVKKITVTGIEVTGLSGTSAYMYLRGFKDTRGQQMPAAYLDMHVKQKNGIKEKTKLVTAGDDLYQLSGGLDAYQGIKISNLHRGNGDTLGYLEFTNTEDKLYVGEVTGSTEEKTKRRIQIMEVIKAHLRKEEQNFAKGVKTLSLFFIDEVARYRNYDREDTKGDYALWFEELYADAVEEAKSQFSFSPEYLTYLQRFEGKEETVHAGYFSIDKSGKSIDGAISRSGDDKGLSKDTDAYDLILKDRERLLSFEEPVRFIFSHSALREGWDNPNVFTLGMLKKSDNNTSRRQEIGRGLRIAVNQAGERQDDPNTVHEINELTVVTDESYTDFVAGLQRETQEAIANRPKRISGPDSFIGSFFQDLTGKERKVDAALSKALYFHLISSAYLDESDQLTDEYSLARDNGTLNTDTKNPALAANIDVLWPVVDAYLPGNQVHIRNGRHTETVALNRKNFERAEFKKLWNRINQKATYRVEFDSAELIDSAINQVNSRLNVTKLSYKVVSASQTETLRENQLETGSMMRQEKKRTVAGVKPVHSKVRYDLIGKIAAETALTRKTVGAILAGIRPDMFALYAQNPEDFIAKTSKIINGAKASHIIQHVTYNLLNETFDTNEVFSELRTNQNIEGQQELDKHIYEYLLTDSAVERRFARELEANDEVLVYAKLPGAFYIPTPMGNYNPDWAVVFKEGTVKHLYFIAETKGNTGQGVLRGFEDGKIESAKEFFRTLNRQEGFKVSFKEVTSYQEMINVVQGSNPIPES